MMVATGSSRIAEGGSSVSSVHLTHATASRTATAPPRVRPSTEMFTGISAGSTAPIVSWPASGVGYGFAVSRERPIRVDSRHRLRHVPPTEHKRPCWPQEYFLRELASP